MIKGEKKVKEKGFIVSAKLKNLTMTLLKLTIAAGLIIWMISKGAIDFSVLKLITHPLFLFTFLLLTLTQITVNTLRWHWLLKGVGISIPFRYTLSTSFVGLFFNYFMPGGVGGDFIKGFYLIKDYPEKKLAGATSILIDRILGMYMMFVVAIVALLFSFDLFVHIPKMIPLTTAVLIAFLALSAIFLVSLSRRVRHFINLERVFKKIPGGHFLNRIYNAVHDYRGRMTSLYYGLGLSLISQFTMILFMIVVAKSMNQSDIPLRAYFIAIPLSLVCTALPITPAGVGVGQAAIFFLFQILLGKESNVGPNGFTLHQIISFFWGLIGGIIYLQKKAPVAKMSEGSS